MSKVSDYLMSDKGKRMTNFFYGTGAAVVILGALFKIEHWPGASWMLGIGMCTEAVLFDLSAWESPHKEYDWSLVFPVLGYGQHGDDENLNISMPAMPGMMAVGGSVGMGVVGNGGGSGSAFSGVNGSTAVTGVGGAGGTTSALSNFNIIEEEDVRKLSDGIRRLGDTAAQLNSIADASVVTNTYIKAISNASDAASAFANSQNDLKLTTDNLVQNSRNVTSSMVGISDVSKGYIDRISGITQSLSSINSLYEVQLKNINTQNSTLGSLTTEMDKIKMSLESSAREAEFYKEQSSKLTQQINALNNVYGTMLNAIS
jgi:hypothetical protein